MKPSGICHFACIDPPLVCLIQSSSLQANQGSTEESKGAENEVSLLVFLIFHGCAG